MRWIIGMAMVVIAGTAQAQGYQTNRFGQPAWMDHTYIPVNPQVDRFGAPVSPESMIPNSPTGSWHIDRTTNGQNRREVVDRCEQLSERTSSEVQRIYNGIKSSGYDYNRNGSIPTWVVTDTYHALQELLAQANESFRRIEHRSPSEQACQDLYSTTVSRARAMAKRVTG